jgi:hypothetical protein
MVRVVEHPQSGSESFSDCVALPYSVRFRHHRSRGKLDLFSERRWPHRRPPRLQILTGGEVPYGHVDDYILRHGVINDGRRPLLGDLRLSNKLEVLVKSCWAQDPNQRPSFDAIVPVMLEIIQQELAGDDDDNSLSGERLNWLY